MTQAPHADPRGAPADSPIGRAAPISADAPGDAKSGPFRRLRVAAGGVGAAVLGAAPHVLHHAGLLAGAAIFAGFGGKLIFFAIGLVAAIPLLVKMRRRSGSWRRPAAALALFGTLFALTSFVVAPAILSAGSGDGPSTPSSTPSSVPPGHDPELYKQHNP